MSAGPIKDLNHVGVIVPDIKKAMALWTTVFGIKCTEPVELVPDRLISFAELKNAKIEFIQPLKMDNDHGEWLQQHPLGGIHHVCFHTNNLSEGRAQMEAAGIKALSDAPLKLSNGEEVLFFDPNETMGVLTELCEGSFDGN